MAILSSKWVIAVIILLLILLFLFIIGKKSVHTEIKIQAPPSAVWSVLTDLPGIREWNQVLIPIEGELIEGNLIKYEFHQDETSTSVMSAKVIQLIPEKLINQKGGMEGILTFNHKYILESVEEGTKVTIHEDYRGIMVPFWNPAPVEKAYAQLLKSLKERVLVSKN